MGGKCCKCEDNARTTNKHEEQQMTSLGSGTSSSIRTEELTDSEPQPPLQPAQPPTPPPTLPPPPPRQKPQVRDLLTNVCD